MKRSLSLLCAIVLAVAAPAAAAQGFPTGDVFRPLVADPIETRSFVSVVGLDAERAQSTFAPIGVGLDFPLHRWAGNASRDGWQLGFFAAIQSQFDLEGDSFPLVNTDYRVGFPLTFRRGDVSGRVRLFHQSSHLGDEFLLQGGAPARMDLSIEAIDAVLAWDRGNWRPYAGALYMLHRDPPGLERAALQVGVDYTGTRPVLWGARLAGGIDVRALQESDWRAGRSAKVGLAWGGRRPDGRGVTVMLEYFDGSAPFGQFYRDVLSYYGVALEFHY